MKQKLLFFALVIFMVSILSAGLVAAQEPDTEEALSPQEEPGKPLPPQPDEGIDPASEMIGQTELSTAAGVGALATVGTTFTYQGSLTNGGAPASGNYDFEFKLYNDPATGGQVGPTLNQTVAVLNGIFTADLDFGPVFNGAALYLEIGVRPGGSAGLYTTLSPRQGLTPAPLAFSLRPGAKIIGAAPGDAVIEARNTAGGSSGIRVQGGDNLAPDLVLGGNSTLGDDGRIVSDPSYSGSDIFLISNDALVMQLDSDKGGEDADVEIRDKDYGLLFDFDESSELSMFIPGTLTETVEIRSEEFVGSDGAQLRLRNASGHTAVELDAEYNPNGPPEMSFYDRDGTETVEIRAMESSIDGAQIVLRKADGTSSIVLDAEEDGDGRITTEELAITGGSDLSEQFEIRSRPAALLPAPGLVVSIDAAHPGELVISSRAYERTVAGVISGAGGLKPGLMMGQADTLADGKYPVALTGRVYVYADASYGAIEPGDLLTTSNTPGHAMKVTDHTQAQGAILGKAMASLSEGQGLILMLVSLQ